MLRILFSIIVAVHALIHIMGFVKAFNITEIKELTVPISKTMGILWLLAALLFIAALIMFLAGKSMWWMLAAPALILSQILIFVYWQDAKFGALANIIILLPTVVAYGHSNMLSMAQHELSAMRPEHATSSTVTNAQLEELPPVVANWLKNTNVIGRETIRRVHLKQTGELRIKQDGKWMPFTAEQWFTTDEPNFLWLAHVNAGPGFYFIGRDKYVNGHGHMLIKILSLIPVADASGPKTDQGTMLRYLAETVWFPTAALNNNITWEAIDSTSARATMTFKGVTASGEFTFNETGDVISFQAQRYYGGGKDATMETWFIENTSDGFKELNGIRIPTKSTVTWKFDDGNFEWLRLEITDIEYNENAIRRMN